MLSGPVLVFPPCDIAVVSSCAVSGRFIVLSVSVSRMVTGIALGRCDDCCR